MATEQMLIPGITATPRFDGATHDAVKDAKRLSTQLEAVRQLMQNGAWWTVAQLTDAVWKRGHQATTQSISARVRDLRKRRFGGHTILGRRAVGGRGEWEFKLPCQ